jgi:hypothetical protein
VRGEGRPEEISLCATFEELVPSDDPVRPMRAMLERALKGLDGRFEEFYGEGGLRWNVRVLHLWAQLLMQL